MYTPTTFIHALLESHFESLDDLAIVERRFPVRVRADIQRAIESLANGPARVRHFSGIRGDGSGQLSFSELVAGSNESAPVATPPRYEEVDVGEASRPGRIDQAIEFPLPDVEGRRKLIRLHARDVEVPDEVVERLVARTQNVCASFIKELMRRATQVRLERDDVARIELRDADEALDELCVRGGTYTSLLLGGCDDRNVGN